MLTGECKSDKNILSLGDSSIRKFLLGNENLIRKC